MTINKGPVSYHNNSLANNTPATSSPEEGGYEHYQEKMEGRKVRNRSDSFRDHFSQATMFWNSMSNPEKEHITDAFCFEIGKVKNKSVQQQVVDMFANVNLELANVIADTVGANPPTGKGSAVTKASPALSQENMVKKPNTRKVGVIANRDGDGNGLQVVVQTFKDAGLNVEVVSEDKKFKKESDRYVTEAFNHFKAVGADPNAASILAGKEGSPGVVNSGEGTAFVDAVTAHRHWNREV
jgi:catalase